jgi:hypothetical protein
VARGTLPHFAHDVGGGIIRVVELGLHISRSARCVGVGSDYPLLLSSFIARTWKAGGVMDAIAPVATAFVFFGVTTALPLSAIALLRGAASALLAGLVTLSTTALLV